MSVGIMSVGAYIPYYYIKRETVGKAWQAKGQKGERSLANVDEDSVTMAVEAAINCCNQVARQEIDALYFASTTAPYAEKSSSALIATACDLDRKVFTCDFANSTKAGTGALKAAYDAARANESYNVLVCAADSRNAHPKSDQEQLLGDAAAAFVIGSANLLATLDYFTTVSTEIVDVWRNSGELFTSVGEDRFIETEGYLATMVQAVEQALKETGAQPSDISKVVFSTSNLRQATVLARKTGFTGEQIQDALMLNVGDSGAAQPLLCLIGALEHAKPGDKILMASYGSGADVFIFTATDKVGQVGVMAPIQTYLENREEFVSYARFLSFKGIAEAKPGAPFKLPASASMTWREQEFNLRFYASRCKKCGEGIFPVNRICHNCGSKDEFDKLRSSDKATKVYTYSIDQYAGRSDDPVLVQTVSEDADGIRYYTIMTDFRVKDVEVGMEVEFVFRKMHKLGNFNNYYWKCRPVRRKRV